jgi:hypothetical protein
MDDSGLIMACRRIYAETGEVYQRYRTELGESDFGFKVLYGPPRLNPEILFIGEQPGGRVADEKPNERFEWPKRSEYATEGWDLALAMQSMFDTGLLDGCVATNRNFFRAPNAETWKTVPKDARDHLEKFCAARLATMISLMAPKLVIAIGFSVLDRSGLYAPVLRGTANRVLMRAGKIGQWPAVAMLHLTGARPPPGGEDRLAIANAVREFVNGSSDAIPMKQSDQADGLTSVGTRPRTALRLDDLDPKTTVALLDELVAQGLTDDAFARLHHSRDTIRPFRQYCLKTGRFRANENNARIHERLRYVRHAYHAHGLPAGGFYELAERAFAQIPPISSFQPVRS